MQDRAKPGDIFAMQIVNGQYIFGRVLLDISVQCQKSGLIDMHESPLNTFEDSYLIEVYGSINKIPEINDHNVVIHGIVVDSEAFEEDVWKVIGFNKVDPKKIDFNEYLISELDGEVFFIKGELVIPTDLLEDDYFKFKSFGALKRSIFFDCWLLPLLGREELVDTPVSLSVSDIRFHSIDIRKEIYENVKEDLKEDYYSLALKHGFDTNRFFK
jgi:hypothetical protein